jgi:hypothetical protein
MGDESVDHKDIIQLSHDVDDFFMKIGLTYKVNFSKMAATFVARLVKLAIVSNNTDLLQMLLESGMRTLDEHKNRPERLQ